MVGLIVLWDVRNHAFNLPKAILMCGIVVLLGLLTLLEHLLGLNFGIDELVFKDHVTNPLAFPGRMATPTALCFILIGIALMLIPYPTMQRLVQALALTVGGFGSLAILGYIYNVASLYTLYQNNPMALHTAISFVLISLGVVFIRPDRGLMRLLSVMTGHLFFGNSSRLRHRHFDSLGHGPPDLHAHLVEHRALARVELQCLYRTHRKAPQAEPDSFKRRLMTTASSRLPSCAG